MAESIKNSNDSTKNALFVLPYREMVVTEEDDHSHKYHVPKEIKELKSTLSMEYSRVEEQSAVNKPEENNCIKIQLKDGCANCPQENTEGTEEEGEEGCSGVKWTLPEHVRYKEGRQTDETHCQVNKEEVGAFVEHCPDYLYRNTVGGQKGNA